MQTATSPEISYGLGWNIGKTEDGKKQVQHSGILWTYKAEEVLLPEQGYGIVMLFNSGLNAFIDYYSFTNGITQILSNHSPHQPFYNDQLLEAFMFVLILVTLVIGIRKIKNTKKWEIKYKKRTKWLLVLNIIISLLPIYLISFLPQSMAFIGGGRVIHLKGIFLMMPSVIIWLCLASLLSLIIVITLVFKMVKFNKTIQHST